MGKNLPDSNRISSCLVRSGGVIGRAGGSMRSPGRGEKMEKRSDAPWERSTVEAGNR